MFIKHDLAVPGSSVVSCRDPVWSCWNPVCHLHQDVKCRWPINFSQYAKKS